MSWGTCFAAVFASWLVFAVDAAMAAPVMPVTLVRSPEELTSVSIGVSDRGDAVASWSDRPLVRAVVRVAHERAGRSRWAISRPLSEGENPRLAVDARGDAVAIWTSHLGPGAPTLLETAVRPARVEHWLAPTVIATLQPADEGEQTEAMPSVAIGSGGEVLIVWSEGSEEPDTPLAVEPGRVIRAVSGSARTGRFGTPSALSRATDFAHAPEAALDGRGEAVVVWQAGLRATTVFEGEAIQVAGRPSGGDWHQPITLARRNGGLSNPQVAIDAEGRAVAVWEHGLDHAPGESSTGSAVESAFGSASAASWGAAQALSSPGEVASHVDLASAPTGMLFAVWERPSRTTNAVVAISGSTASGSWAPEATVALWDHVAPPIRSCPRGGSCPFVRQLPLASPRVAMNARGDAELVWQQAGAYRPFIRAASWSSARRGWPEPVRVSAPGAAEARVALDASADAFVIWRTEGPQAATALEAAELPHTVRCAAARCSARTSTRATASSASRGVHSQTSLDPS